MSKKKKSSQQWKTVRGVELNAVARTCEKWADDGWTVFAILGPFSDGFVIVMNRMLTL